MVVQFLNMTILSNANSQEYVNIMILSKLMMIICLANLHNIHKCQCEKIH
jgi:hypothetical protein